MLCASANFETHTLPQMARRNHLCRDQSSLAGGKVDFTGLIPMRPTARRRTGRKWIAVEQNFLLQKVEKSRCFYTVRPAESAFPSQCRGAGERSLMPHCNWRS